MTLIHPDFWNITLNPEQPLLDTPVVLSRPQFFTKQATEEPHITNEFDQHATTSKGIDKTEEDLPAR